jgi:eukaryotic-like serine/threonine-protein kinase
MRHRPGDLIDHYEIVEVLGEGAYAEAYKARNTANGTTVVLKSPNPQLFADPSLFPRYQREIEIAKRLDHPGVVRSLDQGGHRTEPYLVLEFVDGDTLRAVLRAMPEPPSVEVALGWARQLAEALAYLHTQGIVHRDLKPENVLVDADGTLKIADFGTAMLEGARRLTWKHLTDSLGTPDYMSPEQVQGERGDKRSDVYAWGIIAYELLTGSVPYKGDNWLAAMAGHLQGNPRRIRQWRPEVPAALEAVVLHAMRRYPEARYQATEDLVADLDRLDTLDPATYDLSPEPPMGGMAAAGSAAKMWLYIVLLAVGFLAAVALLLVLEVLLR